MPQLALGERCKEMRSGTSRKGMAGSGVYLLVIGVNAVPSWYRFVPIVLDGATLEEYHEYVA